MPEAPLMSAPFSLDGHHAVITGGGSGLGLAAARCFIASGARATIVGTNEAKLKKAAEELGEAAAWAVFDVTKTAEAEDFAAKIAASPFGPASILVNNAGINIKKPMAELTPADFDLVVSVHVNGAYALTRAFLPQLEKAKDASILFTASMATYIGLPFVAGYTAAKSAHGGMVRGMSVELAAKGIRVNGVAPGWIMTEMLRQMVMTDPARKAKIEGRIPSGTFGEPEDIGWAMTYLVSPAARYVSGHILVVDGGALNGF